MLNQKIIQEIIKLQKELCFLLESMHPIETLKRAYWEHKISLVTKIEKTEWSYFAIEYLQSLFISIDIKDTLIPPTDEKKWKKIKQKISQIHYNCLSPFLINQKNKNLSQKEKEWLYQILISSIQIRGNRYTIQEPEHLNSLLKPHDEILKELYNLTAKDISEGIRKIYSIINFSPKENLDIEHITKWPTKFIKKFSAKSGSTKSFLTTGKYPGTPFQLLPIVKKPFLEYDSRFYLFCNYSLTDHFYRNIQSSVLEDRTDYSETWNQKQKEVSEQIPFEMLKKIIAPIKTNRIFDKKQKKSKIKEIKNFQYKIEGYPKGRCWFECDGIILFEKWLFVIEVKSGKACYQSPAEDIDPHFKNIKQLLVEAAKQGRRFLEALRKKGSIDIYDSKGKSIIDKISVNDFNQSLVWAVSLEQLTDMSPQVQQFKTLGLENKGESVICISIDDLRIYRDLSNGVIEFYHFLTERKKAFFNKELSLYDELDHFGLYLEINQYHNVTESKQFKKATTIFFDGFRDKIDSYFRQLYFEPEKAIKLKQKIPNFLKDILIDLETNRKPEFIRTGIAIYALSGEAKKEASQQFLNVIDLQKNQKRMRPATFLWGNLTVSLIIRMPEIQPDFIPRDYAIKNMFIQEKEEVLLLDISLDEKDKIKEVSFEWIKKENLSEDAKKKYKKDATQFAEFRFFNRMKNRNKKKIGRNEKCLCGSGKKYKKCHGLKT